MAHYGYIRVSTETQAEHGYGLATQQAAIMKYAADHGITIERVFRDEGVSGAAKDADTDEQAISKRTGLLELLATITEADTVIILNTSRLWRNTVTMVAVQRALKKTRAKVISIEQPTWDLYSEGDPNDFLIRTITDALDVYERMNINIKLARGRAAKAAKGDKPAGVTPYGYQYAPDKKSVVIDQAEAKIVRIMFSEAQRGGTLSTITDLLNAKGIKTRRGNEWTRGSVRAILHNRFYIGELQHKGTSEKGNHEPLISKIQFGKVQAQLDRRHK